MKRRLGRKNRRLYRNWNHLVDGMQNLLLFLRGLVRVLQSEPKCLLEKVQPFLPPKMRHPLQVTGKLQTGRNEVVPVNSTLDRAIQDIHLSVELCVALVKRIGLHSRFV